MPQDWIAIFSCKVGVTVKKQILKNRNRNKQKNSIPTTLLNHICPKLVIMVHHHKPARRLSVVVNNIIKVKVTLIGKVFCLSSLYTYGKP